MFFDWKGGILQKSGRFRVELWRRFPPAALLCLRQRPVRAVPGNPTAIKTEKVIAGLFCRGGSGNQASGKSREGIAGGLACRRTGAIRLREKRRKRLPVLRGQRCRSNQGSGKKQRGDCRMLVGTGDRVQLGILKSLCRDCFLKFRESMPAIRA